MMLSSRNTPSDWQLHEETFDTHLVSRGSSVESATTGGLPYKRLTKKKRAKYPKVRTGCINCKKRHVKCDETKPSCNRCLKWKGSCSGYGTDSGDGTSPPSGLDTSSHEDECWVSPGRSDTHTSHPVIHNGRMLVPKTLGHSAVNSDDNFRDVLTHETNYPAQAMYLHDSSALGSEFWTKLAPQLAQRCPAVHSAQLAIQMYIHEEADQPEENRGERAFAVYGQALRYCMQASMTPGHQRWAVMCSLLFVIFDLILDDTAAAKTHFQGGQRMLDEYLSATGQDNQWPRRNLLEELEYALHFVADQGGSVVLLRDWKDIIQERASLLDHENAIYYVPESV